MTTPTISARHNMCRRLTRCYGAVMARRATTRHLSMINTAGWFKSYSHVTALAGIRTCYVRRRLTRRCGAVVT